MFGPISIETNLRVASMRQIHCAIEHVERGDYECAITLAAAAEGMLPEPQKPYFRGKVKKLSESEEIKAAGSAIGPNDYSVWLKHGTFNGVKIEEVTFQTRRASCGFIEQSLNLMSSTMIVLRR
jgi:hypothetical protein